MIIDRQNPDHIAVFVRHFEQKGRDKARALAEAQETAASLHGEVLLEETIDERGYPTGFVTASLEVAAWFRACPAPERTAAGWDCHQAVLDALPIDLLVPAINPAPNRAR